MTPFHSSHFTFPSSPATLRDPAAAGLPKLLGGELKMSN